MNKLTSKQCDAFMTDHRSVYISCYGYHPNVKWQVGLHLGDETFRNYLNDFNTREAAITAYWQKYHKDWTPPVEDAEEWSAEKAILYMGHERLNVRLNNCALWVVSQPDYGFVKDSVFTTAIRLWKAKYDPDKPEMTREEKAVELLGELLYRYNRYINVTDRLSEKIDIFLKEADHVDE